MNLYEQMMNESKNLNKSKKKVVKESNESIYDRLSEVLDKSQTLSTKQYKLVLDYLERNFNISSWGKEEEDSYDNSLGTYFSPDNSCILEISKQVKSRSRPGYRGGYAYDVYKVNLIKS